MSVILVVEVERMEDGDVQPRSDRSAPISIVRCTSWSAQGVTPKRSEVIAGEPTPAPGGPQVLDARTPFASANRGFQIMAERLCSRDA